MKKIFALALAAIMTAGMTTVAFAVEAEEVSIGGTFFHYDDSLGYGVQADVNEGLEPGETYYISLDADDGDSVNTAANEITKSLAGKYNVYAEWKVGELEDLDIQYRKVQLFDGDWDQTGYRYVVEINVPELDAAKTYDVAGEIKVAKTKTAAKDAEAFNLDATVGHVDTIEEDSYNITDESIVKFDKDLSDVELTWGEDEVAMFEVNVAGQGKLNLAYNVDFNKEVADLDKSANMDFLTFEGNPSFNKNGTLYIYADADTYLYQVVDGKLKAVNAEYDEDYEAWTFKTRTLGAYVISDKELEEQVITDGDEDASSSTTEDGGKKNPDTGR